MMKSVKKRVINFIKKYDEIAYRLKILNIRHSTKKLKKIDDKKYIEIQYKRKTGKSLNLDNPITYNEKIQWMKLYYKNPILPKCVDKYEVRNYIAEKIDLTKENILIPLLGVYSSVEEINFETLPQEFIMKLTNGSSFNYICHKKNKIQIRKIKSRFKKWLKINYFSYGREWAYKDVKNRIVCEELLSPSNGNPPEDYRFFCFNGKVKLITVDIDSVIDGIKNSNYYRNLYNEQWNRINATIQYPNKPNYDVPKPKRLNEMIKIAEKLSEDFPAVRVDLYYFDDKIYFGELTFYHSSGYQNIQPYSFAKQMGNWINLTSMGILDVSK